MIEKTLTLKNRLGLHARAAAKLVHLSAGYASRVTLTKGENEVDGKSILGLLLLAGAKGDTIRFRVDGPDEGDAIGALESLVDRRFDEAE